MKKRVILGLNTTLVEMDVQNLSFPDDFFDTVFATFVFCSVPDTVRGIRELGRVCKPDGTLLFLEHMRPGGSFLGPLFDFLQAGQILVLFRGFIGLQDNPSITIVNPM